MKNSILNRTYIKCLYLIATCTFLSFLSCGGGGGGGSGSSTMFESATIDDLNDDGIPDVAIVSRHPSRVLSTQPGKFLFHS